MFLFNDTASSEIYTLSLHDALPISGRTGPTSPSCCSRRATTSTRWSGAPRRRCSDRKSTRLNSSHVAISYAVFCSKKKRAWLTALTVGGQYKPGSDHDDSHSFTGGV